MFPDNESGTRLAKNLLSSGFVDVIELSNGISLIDLDVKPEWEGKTLVELNLRKKYTVNVVAIRRGKTLDTTVDPNLKLDQSMQLVVLVNTAKLYKLK